MKRVTVTLFSVLVAFWVCARPVHAQAQALPTGLRVASGAVYYPGQVVPFPALQTVRVARVVDGTMQVVGRASVIAANDAVFDVAVTTVVPRAALGRIVAFVFAPEVGLVLLVGSLLYEYYQMSHDGLIFDERTQKLALDSFQVPPIYWNRQDDTYVLDHVFCVEACQADIDYWEKFKTFGNNNVYWAYVPPFPICLCEPQKIALYEHYGVTVGHSYYMIIPAGYTEWHNSRPPLPEERVESAVNSAVMTDADALRLLQDLLYSNYELLPEFSVLHEIVSYLSPEELVESYTDAEGDLIEVTQSLESTLDPYETYEYGYYYNEYVIINTYENGVLVNTVTTPRAEPKPRVARRIGKVQCEEYPESLACSDTDEPPTEDLDRRNVEISQIIPVGLGGGGGCPSPQHFSVFGKSFDIDYSPACEYATMLKQVVVAICWIISGYIVLGIKRRNETDLDDH